LLDLAWIGVQNLCDRQTEALDGIVG